MTTIMGIKIRKGTLLYKRVSKPGRSLYNGSEAFSYAIIFGDESSSCAKISSIFHIHIPISTCK